MNKKLVFVLFISALCTKNSHAMQQEKPTLSQISHAARDSLQLLLTPEACSQTILGIIRLQCQRLEETLQNILKQHHLMVSHDIELLNTSTFWREVNRFHIEKITGLMISYKAELQEYGRSAAHSKLYEAERRNALTELIISRHRKEASDTYSSLGGIKKTLENIDDLIKEKK